MQVNTLILFLSLWLLTDSILAENPTYKADIQPLVAKYCVKCHSGKRPKGKIDFSQFMTDDHARKKYEVWQSALELLEEREMPPEDEPQPTEAERAKIKAWYEEQLVRSVKAHPGFFKPRRLSAAEYRNTLHTLFGFDLEVNIAEAEQTVAEKSLVMKLLPLDPPGKSGYRNDTSGNPLTTVIWNQYSYLTDAALEQFFSSVRREQLESITGPIAKDGITQAQAEKLIRDFLPRVYRRSIPESDLEKPLMAIKASDELITTLKVEMKAALMSPGFMYRGLLMPAKPDKQQPVDDFELAERLSYFLWADMPDEKLLESAREGKLNDDSVLKNHIDRMLASPKARSLTDDFATQWLTLDEVAKNYRNPPQQVAFKTQPLDFMNYLFTSNRPLIELVDSKVAFVNQFTQGYYPRDRHQLKRYRKPKGVEIAIIPNQMIQLDKTPERGGILTIPGILQMNRGPILRGVWILERLLGEHLPEPPPDVGQVPQNKRGEKLTFRQRFELHRSKKTCAVCHDKIDPLGFGLTAYDNRGIFLLKDSYTPTKKERKRGLVPTEADRKGIDASGQLPTGEKFKSYQELKQILITSQREKVIRNIVRQMLSYALCRKLEIFDRPTVEEITRKVNNKHSTYRDLIYEIANSLPFRKTVVQGKKS